MFPWQHNAESASFQNKIALRNQQGDIFTWRECAYLIDKTAYCLYKQGVTANSGVAFYSKNSMEVVLLYLATIQLGARILGINPAFSTEKLQTLCQMNDIQFYYSSTTEPVIPNLKALTLDINNHNSDLKVVLNNDLIIDFKSPATMTLTSGSTGLPKAVVHNVQAHLDNAIGVCELMDFNSNCSWLLSLPLYHVSGQGIIWRWLAVGGELQLPQDNFYLSVLQATHCSLVPTQLQRLLEYIKTIHNTDDIKVKHILLGGTYIPIELTQQLLSLGICSYSGYGMTEMASTVFAKKSNLSNGVGQPLKGRKAKLVNDEIWLKGAGLALGYWQNSHIISLLNQDGWFETKDQGIWKDDELVILGRIDNMFISGGENIHPEEIECTILKYPNTEQVFVFPIPDKVFGNRPVAMIKLKEILNEENINKLRSWLVDKLEKFKQPIKYIELDTEKYQSQGQIKISRALLQKELTLLLGTLDEKK